MDEWWDLPRVSGGQRATNRMMALIEQACWRRSTATITWKRGNRHVAESLASGYHKDASHLHWTCLYEVPTKKKGPPHSAWIMARRFVRLPPTPFSPVPGWTVCDGDRPEWDGLKCPNVAQPNRKPGLGKENQPCRSLVTESVSVSAPGRNSELMQTHKFKTPESALCR